MRQVNDPKHVTPKQRPREFPNQKLVVSGGKKDSLLHDYFRMFSYTIIAVHKINTHIAAMAPLPLTRTHGSGWSCILQYNINLIY